MNNQISIYIVFWLLLAHFIGDFICQSDWMAQGKSKKFLPLFIHCVVYSWVIYVFSGNILFTLVNFLLHFVIDFFTSRVNSWLWNKKEIHWFFVGVGTDQFCHYLCLITTYQLIVNPL